MILNLRLLLLLCLLPAFPAAAGQRVVMDFNSVAISSTSTVNVASPYVEDHLRISTGGAASFGMLSTNDQYSTGRKSLHYAGTTTLTLAGGGTFSPVSMLLVAGNLSANTSSNPVATFVAVKANGQSTSYSIAYDSNWQANRPRTFDGLGAGMDDIVSLRWSSNYLLQFDNITVDLPDEVQTSGGGVYTESYGTVAVRMSVPAPLATAVTATWTIADVTTTAGSDYTSPGGANTGLLTLPAGQTEAVLNIPLLNDTAAESPESFTVSFTNLAGGFFAAGENVVTVNIASDDSVASFAGWMTAHGLTGNEALPDADPNCDGVSNIESWLCRINPAGPSPAAWLDRRASYFTTAANVPGLRLTVPTPLPSDVRMIFEETTALSSWSEQTRRSGFATGSLWTGTGASRVVESNTLTARTITFPGSASRSARPHAFYRMKYELVSGPAN